MCLLAPSVDWHLLTPAPKTSSPTSNITHTTHGPDLVLDYLLSLILLLLLLLLRLLSFFFFLFTFFDFSISFSHLFIASFYIYSWTILILPRVSLIRSMIYISLWGHERGREKYFRTPTKDKIAPILNHNWISLARSEREKKQNSQLYGSIYLFISRKQTDLFIWIG